MNEKIDAIIRQLQELKQESKLLAESYSQGDRIIVDDGEYIIACSDRKTVSVINMADGNRWDDPMKVEDTYKIPKEQLQAHIGEYKITRV